MDSPSDSKVSKVSKTFFWDFFGPRAEGTARHFCEHLAGFLAEHAVTGCRTGLVSEGAGHAAAFCEAPPEVQTMIEQSLRPRRVLAIAPSR